MASPNEASPEFTDWAKNVLLKRGMSVVMPDVNFKLASDETKAARALAKGYNGLNKDRQRLSPESSPPRALPTRIRQKRQEEIESAVAQQRLEIHLQSADLFEQFSPVQKERKDWKPKLPDIFEDGVDCVLLEKSSEAEGLVQHDAEKLKALHPKTFGLPYVEVAPSFEYSPSQDSTKIHSALRIGIVLSGGPAPGGHNVIAGVYDYMKAQHDEIHFFGFLGGLDGLFQGKYKLITDSMMDNFRNQGGFDMLWSGRGKISGIKDLRIAHEAIENLQLNGLIIVGGDGSNSNAALLSEYVAEKNCACNVVGVPKTIDGDLKNECVEISFGFDTASKTYSELIGNLCTDVLSSEKGYHMVRVMGRSASHLVLECALQTRPNLVFIGEEIKDKKISLQQIVDDIVNLVVERAQQGKPYGVILVPEGLIEFIPEINQLISELNGVSCTATTLDTTSLSQESRAVWKFLPKSIREQLLSDRESTGYIQVAKIATERLLITLTEAALDKRSENMEHISFMPHYFGYEGRCAMPSNFDANYCYILGYTAACLVHNNRNGYLAVVRRLDQHVSLWQPAGVPFTSIMEMKSLGDGQDQFPGLIRQLTDLNGNLFKVLTKVRDRWRLSDLYRCPGPIQFEGVNSSVANFTVAVPKENELVHGSLASVELFRRLTEQCNDMEHGGVSSVGWLLEKGADPKYPAILSETQLERLEFKPEISPVCTNPKARAFKGVQYRIKDPYTQRQSLLFYPHLCNSNRFHLYEVLVDDNSPSVDPGLRVGAVFLSRQAPGCLNVLWGIYERLKLVKGVCLAFKGLQGAFKGEYIVCDDRMFAVYRNQGGAALGNRLGTHTLLEAEYRASLRDVCSRMRLDGLILIGSSLAMTEAALVAEDFLQSGCLTRVIGVPASGSGDIVSDLIESNVGFDTSSKVYANLVGNVLTEAASMPKYWHFVRLMGKSPSFEVLEAALQCHPSIVIIAEEYGAAGKTLADVVNDIADVVCRRATMGKNSGAVLIPDGLLTHLPNMNNLMKELSTVILRANKDGKLEHFQLAMVSLGSDSCSLVATSPETGEPDPFASVRQYIRDITPWSLALFQSLPDFVRKELVQVEMGEMRFSVVETEMLIASMVKIELEKRKAVGSYTGTFAAVTHFFGYQGRSSLPSNFDCQLAFSYGHLAAQCIESGLTGFCCTIRRLVSRPRDWRLGAVPLNALLASIPAQQDAHPGLQKLRDAGTPIIPSSEVSLDGKAFRWMKTVLSRWQQQDRYCNPGPIQFEGPAAAFFNRILFEEQAEYSTMLRHVETFVKILGDTCRFGVDETFLKTAYANLHSLLTLRFNGDDLLNAISPSFKPGEYEDAHGEPIVRPTVWDSEAPCHSPALLPLPSRRDFTTCQTKLNASFVHRRSSSHLSPFLRDSAQGGREVYPDATSP